MGCIYKGLNYIKRQSDSYNLFTFWYTLMHSNWATNTHLPPVWHQGNLLLHQWAHPKCKSLLEKNRLIKKYRRWIQFNVNIAKLYFISKRKLLSTVPLQPAAENKGGGTGKDKVAKACCKTGCKQQQLKTRGGAFKTFSLHGCIQSDPAHHRNSSVWPVLHFLLVLLWLLTLFFLLLPLSLSWFFFAFFFSLSSLLLLA